MARDFASIGTVVTGAAADTRPGANKLPGRARPDFHLMHHPENWEIVETSTGEYEWLPRLKPLFLQAGINGVRSVRGGGVDDSAARLSYRERGWTIIPRDLGYVTKYPTARGPSAYLTWDTPHLMGRKIVVRHDAEGYNTFRRSLVESGVIPTPAPEALESVLHSLQSRINRAGKSIHIPGVKARVDADEKRLKGAKAATKRKRAPRKKASANV